MYRVQAPLEFIPPSLRTLQLVNTDLNVTCENLQQSKIDTLSIVNGSSLLNIVNNVSASLSSIGNSTDINIVLTSESRILSTLITQARSV